MARKGLHMIIQEEIQRLKELKFSQRKVAIHLNINRKTVQKYWLGSKKPFEDPLPPWVHNIDWEYIKKELSKGITREILYSELKLNFKLPSYQNFCKQLVRQVGANVEIVVRIPRIAGASLKVDYAGDSIPILNPATGELLHTELFVGTLSYSKKIFAEFTYSQKLEDFISSHNHMFQYYGKVPQYVICDNLKSGVTKADKLDPLVNKTYHDLCKHYEVAVDPADSYKPRHKPNVEKSVDIIQRGFMQEVRHKTYTSLSELNKDLRTYLNRINNKVMPNHGASREDLYKKEITEMRDLPSEPYRLHYWKLAKVHPDCHVQLDYNYYSVPHRYVGQQVEVKYNKSIVEIYTEGIKIACHATQVGGRSQFSTHEGHYPEKKIVELQIHFQRVTQWAKKIGPETTLLINKIFTTQCFPLKNLRRAQAILSLSKTYSNAALEFASKQALVFHKTNYRYIESCVKNYRPKITTNENQAPVRDKQFICLQGGSHE
jgi:transposase